jgi:hypothetical protein
VTTLTVWLDNGGEAVLLCEIDLPDGTVYLSDTPYITTPGDLPGGTAVSYSPVLDGLPDIRRDIGILSGGGATTSYGDLSLVTSKVYAPWLGADIDLSTTSLRSAPCRLYLAAPISAVPFSQRYLLFSGYCGACSGTYQSSLKISLTDETDRLANITIKLNTFDGVGECASWPSDLTGTARPIAYGLGRIYNVSPTQVCQGNLTYEYTDPAYSARAAVVAVYDDAVAVTAYTDLGGGRLRLTNAPAGSVTCDVTGWQDSALTGAEDDTLLYGVLRHWGGLEVGQIDIGPYLDGTLFNAATYITADTSVADLASKICEGEIWWWGVRRDGVVTVRLIKPVGQCSGSSCTLTPSDVLDDMTWKISNEISYAVDVKYRRNFTVQDPATGADANRAVLSKTEWKTDRYQDNSILTTYPDSDGTATIETMRSSAVVDIVSPTLGERYIDIFGGPRMKIEARVPLYKTIPLGVCPLGECVRLSGFGSPWDGLWVCSGISDSSGASGLEAKLTLWGAA